MLVTQLRAKLKRLGVAFDSSDLKADLEKKLEKVLKAKEKEKAQAQAEPAKPAEKPKEEPKPAPQPEKPRKVRVRHESKESEPEPKKNVVFEKRKVLKILNGGHNKTHFHCQMEGGITQHVPKSLFR